MSPRDPILRPLQTLTVQYDVESIDGVTPSKPFSRDPTSETFIAPNAEGIYVVKQGAVGLIDPDLGVGGSMGDRFIPWIEVCRDAPDTVEIAIVDGEDPDKLLEVVEGPTAVTPTSPLYLTQFFRCPQGGLIRIRSGLDGPGKIRFRILLECEDCPPSGGGGRGQTGPTGPTGPSGPASTIPVPTGPVSTVPGPTGPTGPTGPSGGTPPLQSATFLDDTTEDLTIGPDSNGYYAVEANISKATPESTSYRIDFAVSATGVDVSVLEVQSNVPVTDIAVSALILAGQVTLRLTGTGAGISTTINYRVVDTVVRAL